MKNTMQKMMCAMVFLSAGSTFSMEAPKKTDDLDPAIKLIRYFVHHMNGKVKKLTGVYEIDEAYLFKLYYSDNLSRMGWNRKIRSNFDKRQEKKILENYKEALNKYRSKKMLELTETKNIFGPWLFCILKQNIINQRTQRISPQSITSYMFSMFFEKKELINRKKVERLAFDGLPFLFVKSMMQTDEDQNLRIQIIKNMIDNYKAVCNMPEYKKIIKPYEPLLKLKIKDQTEKRIQKEFHRFIDGGSETYYKLFFDLETKTIKAIDDLINKYLKKPGHGFIHLSFPEQAYNFSEKGGKEFFRILEKNIKDINHLKLYQNNHLNLFSLKYCPPILNLQNYCYPYNVNSALETPTSLRELYFTGKDFKNACYLIKNSPHLEVLSINVHNNDIENSHEYSDICNAIKNNKNIRNLFFRKHFLHFQDAEILFNALTGHPLTTLKLNIAESSFDQKNKFHTLTLFFDFLKNNKILLNVCCNLTQYRSNFEHIQTTNYYQINNFNSIENLAINTIESNNTLKSFSFRFNHDIKINLNRFYQGLNKNTSIEKLRLIPNDLCPNLDLTFKILQEQKYIRHLIMDFYPKENINSFFELLKVNKTLTSLKVCHTFFQDQKCIFDFFKSIYSNESILRLKLTRPKEETQRSFFDYYLNKYIMSNKKLQFLHIDLSFAEISTLSLSPIAEGLKTNKSSQIQRLLLTNKINQNNHPNYNEPLKFTNDIKIKLDSFCQIIQKNFLCNIEKYSGMVKIRLGKRIENNIIQIQNYYNQQFNENNKKRKMEATNNKFIQYNQNNYATPQKKILIDLCLENLPSTKKEHQVFMPDFKNEEYNFKKKREKWKNLKNSIDFKERVHYLYITINQCAKDQKTFNFIIKNGFENPSTDKVFFNKMQEYFLKKHQRILNFSMRGGFENASQEYFVEKEKLDFIKFIKDRINFLPQTDSVYQKNSKQAFNKFFSMNFFSAFYKAYNNNQLITNQSSPDYLFFLGKTKFYSDQKLALDYIQEAAHQKHLASSYFLSLMILKDINNQEIEYQKKTMDIMLFFKVNHLLPDHFSSLLPNNFTDYDFLILPTDPIHIPSIIERFEKISCIAKVEFEKALKMFGFSNQDEESK